MNEQSLFHRRLQARYARAFSALDATVKLGDDFVAATQGLDLGGAGNRALNIIFARMYTNFEAAAVLLKQGFGVEGGMLTRAFLEGFFNFRYVVSIPEPGRAALAERFFRYGVAARFMNLRTIAKAGGNLPKGELRRAKQEWKDEWVKHYGWDDIPNQLDWSGLKLSDKAEKGQVTPVYRWLNRHFSEMVHCGPDAWQHAVEESGEKTILSYGPADDRLIELPIPALGYLFCNVVHALAEVFNLPEVLQKADETAAIIGATFGEIQDV